MRGATADTITIDTWRSWQTAGQQAQLVDVRSETEFATVHLPGAINIPLEQIELRTADLNSDRPVVLVCKGGTRAHMARELLAEGDRKLIVLEGGTDAWIQNGYPVVRNTIARWALERQVRLIAGALVAAGVLLAAVVSPWWLVVPGLVGCGLIFAGVSGLCLMGEALARLPWNRTRIVVHDTSQQVPRGVSCACELGKRP